MRGSHVARILAALALIAMAMRALTPAGYMPAPASEPGRFLAVALCTGFGPAEAVIDLKTGSLRHEQQQDDGKDRTHAAACAFAAIAQLSPPEAALALPNAERIALAATRSLRPPTRLAALAAPPPWPTGPPSFL